MDMKVRAWHVEKKIMFSTEQLMNDQLTLLANGGFINVSGKSTVESIIYDKEKLIPIYFAGMADLNGNDIYEGDILYNEKESYKGDVWFAGTGFKTDCYGSGVEPLRDSQSVEIIGNIYQNPELVD